MRPASPVKKVRRVDSNMPQTIRGDSLDGNPVEPTPDEKRNGWTKESLAEYLRSRKAEAEAYAVTQAKRNEHPLRVQTTKSYDPHRW